MAIASCNLAPLELMYTFRSNMQIMLTHAAVSKQDQVQKGSIPSDVVICTDVGQNSTKKTVGLARIAPVY